MSDGTATALAGYQARVAEAEGAARGVEAQAREAANRLELASRELASLPADQFDQTGDPLPKTEASRLAGEIRKIKDPPITWSRRLDETRKTARRARAQLDRFIGANVAELVRADEPKGREAGDDVRAQINALIDAINNYQSVVAEFSTLVSKASGLDPQVELPSGSGDQLSNLQRDLRRVLPNVVDPLPRSIFPRDGENPPRVQTEDGWVGIQHINVKEEREAKRQQQEERERKVRRNVDIRPPQPEAAPQVLRDLYSRGGR